MSCESKPDVNSIPIQVGKRRRYIRRRFGLRYQGTVSSFARRVRMGSDAPVWAFFADLKVTIFAFVFRSGRWEASPSNYY